MIRDSSLCKENFVVRMLQDLCQSRDQKLYFKNSKLENVDCNLVEIAEKPLNTQKQVLFYLSASSSCLPKNK